jgi:hypothetical protein
MAQMIEKHAMKIFVFSIVAGLLYFVMIIFYGMPLHDLNLWILGQRYKAIYSYHPRNSILLEKKKYLGGPDDHGSQQCNYVVGEVRSSDLTKEEIKFSYKERSVPSISGLSRIPVGILFFDTETSWKMEYPWGTWWDEINDRFKNATTTIYLVYVAIENYPTLMDLRCDD